MTDSQDNLEVQADAVVRDVIHRRLRGESLPDEVVISLHPSLRDELVDRLIRLRRVERARRSVTPPAAGEEDRVEDAIRLPDVVGYDVLQQISDGGQGVVYLARHRESGTAVALKVLRGTNLTDVRARERFDSEARVMRKLDHPALAKLRDTGVTVDGRPYLVVEYICGQSLNPETLASKPIEERLSLFVEVCRGLQAAHCVGVVHRDLKPSNIRVGSDGRPRVLDFGLAMKPGEYQQSVTATGQFVGTFLWASPEQLAGVTEVTPASDVYSLGVLLYQVLTGGRLPSEVVSSLRKSLGLPLEAAKIKAREVPVGIRQIVSRCLEESPGDRFANAGELGDALAKFLTTPRPIQRFGSLRTWWVGLCLLCVASVALSYTFLRTKSFDAPTVNGTVNGKPPLILKCKLRFVWIPPGTFTMGSPAGLHRSLPDEAEQEVTIVNGFYMLQYEVAQDIYQQVMGVNPSAEQQSGLLPVTNVSWDDAQEFCRRLSKLEGKTIRLPTEAEWEYAARAGETTALPGWIRPCDDGNGYDYPLAFRYANFADRSAATGNDHADSRYDDGSAGPSQVNRYLGNAWQLHDMQGNVWEWTQGPYPDTGAPGAPTSQPANTDYASIRGGSFFDDVLTFRFGNRNPVRKSHKGGNVGFRVVTSNP